MKYQKLYEEKRLWKKGKKFVAGLDEAGRGPLAGPVIAAASVLVNFRKFNFRKLVVDDSKKLTPIRREKAYKDLINSENVKWAIGKASEKIIDKINILEATKLAMQRAVINLEKKLQKKSKKQKHNNFDGRRNRYTIDLLILDGNFGINLPIPQKSIIKADEKIFTCQASSIIAKVHRDRIMEKYHQKYPQYEFNRHKGYPTKYHKKMLKKYGPCKIHRKTFKPVKLLLN